MLRGEISEGFLMGGAQLGIIRIIIHVWDTCTEINNVMGMNFLRRLIAVRHDKHEMFVTNYPSLIP